jgi:hypothetical protein
MMISTQSQGGSQAEPGMNVARRIDSLRDPTVSNVSAGRSSLGGAPRQVSGTDLGLTTHHLFHQPVPANMRGQ